VKVREAKFGRDDPVTLNATGNLGTTYKDAGRLKEAILLLEKAHRAVKKHPNLGWVREPLIDAYTKAGENDKAAALIREDMVAVRKMLPRGSPQVNFALAESGRRLLENRKWEEADRLIRECLAIRLKHLPDDWRTFNAQSMLGGALLGQKKYAKAEPLLVKGYEGLKQREKTIPPFGGGDLRIPQALDRLIELYTATNKPDEAKKWRAERAKYPVAKKAAAPEKK